MKSIKIEIPEGYEIDSFDKESGEIKFKAETLKKDVTERIRTVEDVLNDHRLSMDMVDCEFYRVPEHFKWQYIAELLCESLNEGWKPDWDDHRERKYFPWFSMGGSSGFQFSGYGSWGATSCVGYRLCLKSEELAQYAGTQFIDVYRKFMVI